MPLHRNTEFFFNLENALPCGKPAIKLFRPHSEQHVSQRFAASDLGNGLLPDLPCILEDESCLRRRLSLESSSPSPKILYPEWQAEYLAALLEADPRTLFERVTAAETAIFNRLQAMSHNSDCRAERQAIEDAVASLRVLKRDKLGFPEWEKK
jgi:hypothetical protein